MFRKKTIFGKILIAVTKFIFTVALVHVAINFLQLSCVTFIIQQFQWLMIIIFLYVSSESTLTVFDETVTNKENLPTQKIFN